MKKNIILITAILLSFIAPVCAKAVDFKSYDLISSANLAEQERTVDAAVNLVNAYFNGASTDKKEFLDKLNDYGKRLFRLGNELNSIGITESLKNLHEVNLKAANNYFKVLLTAGEIWGEYDINYTQDYVKVVKKLEEVNRVVYHTKEARLESQLKFFENNKNTGADERERIFYEYYAEILNLQKDALKSAFEVNFYVLQYFLKKIDKQGLKILMQDNLEAARKNLVKANSVRTDENLADLHKILCEAYSENCVIIKEFINFLNDGKDKDFSGLLKQSNYVNELFESYEMKRLDYLEGLKNI